MIERYELRYEITDELMRTSFRRVLIHQFGWRMPLAFVVLLLGLIAACMLEDAEFYCGFIAAGLVLMASFLGLSYLAGHQLIHRLGRKMSTRSARCVITQEGMTLENAFATSSLKWTLLDKVVRAPDVWVFFFIGAQQYVALPADKLNADVAALVESRVIGAGGRMAQ